MSPATNIAIILIRQIDLIRRSITILSMVMDGRRLSWWECIIVMLLFWFGLDCWPWPRTYYSFVDCHGYVCATLKISASVELEQGNAPVCSTNLVPAHSVRSNFYCYCTSLASASAALASALNSLFWNLPPAQFFESKLIQHPPCACGNIVVGNKGKGLGSFFRWKGTMYY